MAQLSREEFDAIEFGAARTGDHRGAALRMSELALTGVQTGDMSSAEAHLRAGEQWLLADDPAAAADGFRRALAGGGGTVADARVSLARALFQLGQADEARELISELEAEGRSDPRKCDLVAELLVEQSDLIGALDWANTGVELCLSAADAPASQDPARQEPARQEPASGPAAGQARNGGDAVPSAKGEPPGGRDADPAGASIPRALPPSVDRTELRMLLSLRYRIRHDMGLDEDAYDRLLDEF